MNMLRASSYDPFAECDRRCNHDLAPGVTVADLLERDGPYVPDTIEVVGGAVIFGNVQGADARRAA